MGTPRGDTERNKAHKRQNTRALAYTLLQNAYKFRRMCLKFLCKDRSKTGIMNS